MFFRNDCSSQQCVATLFSRHPHDDGDAMPTCAHDEHTQQHVMLVLSGGRCWQIVDTMFSAINHDIFRSLERRTACIMRGQCEQCEKEGLCACV